MFQKSRAHILTVVLFAALFCFTGCIRLWGGATYVKNKPGDYTEKTYVLDTGRIGEGSRAKGSIQQ